MNKENKKALNKFSKLFFSNDSYLNQVIRSAKLNFMTKVLSILLGFVLSFILSKEYGSSVIGMIAILNALIGIALFSANFGFNKTLLRLMPQYRSRHGINGSIYIYVTILKYLLVSSLLTSLCFLWLNPLMQEHFFEAVNFDIAPLLLLSSFIIVSRSFISFNLQTLRMLYSDKWFNILTIAPKLVNLILLGGVIFFYSSEANAIYANLIAYIVVMIFSLILIVMTFKKFQASYQKFSSSFIEIWKLSWPMFLSTAVFSGMNHIDTLMLGAMKNPGEVGVYHVSTQFANITSFILASLSYRAAPLLSDLYHQNKPEQMIKLAQKTSKIMFWLAFPLFLIIISAGNFLLGIYGETFLSGYWALAYLAFGSLINTASGMVGNLLNVTGHQKAFKNILLTGLVSNIILNMVLIPEYGLSGAAFASMISVMVWNVIGSLYIRYHFKYYIWYYPIIPIRRPQ